MSDRRKTIGSEITPVPEGNALRPMPVNHRSHGNVADIPARHGGKPNIARDGGKGKAVYDVLIHGGMLSIRNGRVFADPMTHDLANPDSPIAKGPGSRKRLSKPMISPGMRSRQDPTFDDEKMTALSTYLISNATMDPQQRQLMNLPGNHLPGTVSKE